MTAHESCSHARLSVFEVTGTGIGEDQAPRLSEALGISAEKLPLRNGEPSFVDPATNLAVPIVHVTVCVPRTSSTPRDQAIFVDQATSMGQPS